MVTRMQNVESLLGAYTEALTSGTAGPEVVRECRDLLMTYLQAQLGQDRPVIDLDTLVVDPLPLFDTESVEFPGFLMAHTAAWEAVVVHAGKVHANVPQRLLLREIGDHASRRVVRQLLELKLVTRDQYAAWLASQKTFEAHGFVLAARRLGIVLTPEQLEKL